MIFYVIIPNYSLMIYLHLLIFYPESQVGVGIEIMGYFLS